MLSASKMGMVEQGLSVLTNDRFTVGHRCFASPRFGLRCWGLVLALLGVPLDFRQVGERGVLHGFFLKTKIGSYLCVPFCLPRVPGITLSASFISLSSFQPRLSASARKSSSRLPG